MLAAYVLLRFLIIFAECDMPNFVAICQKLLENFSITFSENMICRQWLQNLNIIVY